MKKAKEKLKKNYLGNSYENTRKNKQYWKHIENIYGN